MATVRDILARKGSHVQSIGPDATVLDAALLMNDHKIGEDSKLFPIAPPDGSQKALYATCSSGGRERRPGTTAASTPSLLAQLSRSDRNSASHSARSGTVTS